MPEGAAGLWEAEGANQGFPRALMGVQGRAGLCSRGMSSLRGVQLLWDRGWAWEALVTSARTAQVGGEGMGLCPCPGRSLSPPGSFQRLKVRNESSAGAHFLRQKGSAAGEKVKQHPQRPSARRKKGRMNLSPVLMQEGRIWPPRSFHLSQGAPGVRSKNPNLSLAPVKGGGV